MDIITKLKKLLENLYSNKAFKILFLSLFILVVVYKYSNIKDGIKTISSNKESMDELNIPKKINIIKKTQDNFITEVAIKKKEKLEDMKKIEKEELKKEEEENKKNEKIAKLKEEFKSESKKNSYTLKSGDIANVKMIITDGDNYDINIEAMNLPMKVNNDENNMFGRKLLGRKVGEVVLITFREFLEDKSFKNALEKIKKQENLQGVNLDFETMKNSQIVYRIKILGVSK